MNKSSKIWMALLSAVLVACAYLIHTDSLAGTTEIPQEGQFAYYPLDGNAEDWSDNEHDGTIVGDVTPTEDRFGVTDGACYFNGTNARIDIPHHDNLEYTGTNSLTISCWVRLDDPFVPHGAIVCKGGSPGDITGVSSYCIPFTTDRRPAAYINHYASSGFNGLESSEVLTLGEWYHIAVVFDGSDVTLFINGEPDTSAVFTNKPSENTEPLYVGLDADGADEYLHGALDCLFIYNRALTETEIEMLFGAPTAPERPSWGGVKNKFR